MSRDRVNEVAAETLAHLVSEATMHYRYLVEQAVIGCESPIEEIMAAALMKISPPLYFTPNADLLTIWPAQADYPVESFEKAVALGSYPEAIFLFKQRQILDYRVDFLMLAKFAHEGDILRIVIECDGHDFHERTKEQAAHDRRRDREMTAAGYKVFRFTGSEIYRNPSRCAGEIQVYLDSCANSQRGDE